MSGIGPALPPHLVAQRKRKAADAEDGATVGSPAISKTDSPQNIAVDSGEKRRRIVGVAAPPAPLDERPEGGPDSDSSSSSDDDYGPAPPTLDDINNQPTAHDKPEELSTGDIPEKPQRAERDKWMMMPPDKDNLAATQDPTRRPARKFNSGKGAAAASRTNGGGNEIWTETPEQKRKRLENQVMGIADLPHVETSSRPAKDSSRDREAERRIREHTEKTRGKSLYSTHQQTMDKEKEDDPSKRAFDREKDMASGMTISHSKRREMLSKASDFGSKFSKGSFL